MKTEKKQKLLKNTTENPTKQQKEINMKLKEFLKNDLGLFDTCFEELYSAKGISESDLEDTYAVVTEHCKDSATMKIESYDKCETVLGVTFRAMKFPDSSVQVVRDFFGSVFTEKEHYPLTLAKIYEIDGRDTAPAEGK